MPKILENPKIIFGYDVSSEEIEKIIETQKISLEIMEHLASDKFFEIYNKKLNISLKEGEEIDKFLYGPAKHFLSELKIEISYLTK